jgi:small subunit ribosomal protein S21
LNFAESAAIGTNFRHGFARVAFIFESGANDFMQIMVRDNNVDQALRALKKKLQREGVYREMKLRRHYEKPSEKRARERAAAVRRARKMDRKRLERDGVK